MLPAADPGIPISNRLFAEVTARLGIQYRHSEIDFIDFNIQKLLPHKLSEYTPALATGDVDGNGLDDIVCGGSFHEQYTFATAATGWQV